jgi:hypothetical protein
MFVAEHSGVKPQATLTIPPFINLFASANEKIGQRKNAIQLEEST